MLSLNSAKQTPDGLASMGLPNIMADLPPKHPYRIQAEIAQVTPADIMRVARRMFASPMGNMTMGISGPAQVLKQWFPNSPVIQAIPNSNAGFRE